MFGYTHKDIACDIEIYIYIECVIYVCVAACSAERRIKAAARMNAIAACADTSL